MSVKNSISEQPRVIHVIFKTHLDVGFTDLAGSVVQTYVDSFIPCAVQMARALREKHGQRRFVWTTGSWLIHHYLNVAPAQQRKALEEAIFAGDIVWHGLPFTTHTELMDVDLFRVGLGISQELDGCFGRKTIAAKMTDVPGHTCVMLPLLQEAGIELLHIGVNPASTPPSVPNAFRWAWGADGGQGDYAADRASVNVVYDKGSYGGLTRIAGCPDALYFAHTGDNLGPCSAEEVEQTYRRLEKQFPQSRVQASTLDAFAEVLRVCQNSLPVVAQEIGDTWIHGVGTDPWKVSRFRRLRAWRNCLNGGGLSDHERLALLEFDRAMLLVPEHTWGRDVKLHLGFAADYDRRFTREAFSVARGQLPFREMEESWREQRAYLTSAVDILRGTALHGSACAILETPRTSEAVEMAGRPEVNTSLHALDFIPIKIGSVLRTAFFEIGIDGELGAVNHLKDLQTGRIWADSAHLFGAFRYEVFSADDYDCLWHRYNRKHKLNYHWAVPDFLKPGIDSAVDAHQCWQPRLMEAHVSRDGLHLRLKLGFDDDAPYRHFGAPEQLQVDIIASPTMPELRFLLNWHGKPATRVAEASWFSFVPRVPSDGQWRLQKMGEWIDPTKVVLNGNRTLHAVESVRYDGRADRAGRTAFLQIENPDSPLVAPGKRSLVRFSNRVPRLSDGMHFNLHNNTWGTNFPLWYEDDACFEYILRFDTEFEA